MRARAVEGKASVNVFAFDDNSADAWTRGGSLFAFAGEARELQASLHSSYPLFVQGNGTGAAKPTVETTTIPPCKKFADATSNARKPWQGPVNCGVFARAWRESTPFFCAHVVAVNPNQFPTMATFAVDGMADAVATGAAGPLGAPCVSMGAPGQPAPTLCARRLFDQSYPVNLSIAGPRGGVRFSDVLGGSSAAVYRLGCEAPPLPAPAEGGASLVFDGDFEGVDLAVGR